MGGRWGGWNIALKHNHDFCQQNLQLNWKNGHYTLTRIESYSGPRRHDHDGVYAIQYDNKKIVTGHCDGTISVCVCTSCVLLCGCVPILLRLCRIVCINLKSICRDRADTQYMLIIHKESIQISKTVNI